MHAVAFLYTPIHSYLYVPEDTEMSKLDQFITQESHIYCESRSVLSFQSSFLSFPYPIAGFKVISKQCP